ADVVEVAGAQPALDAGRVDLDTEKSGPVHGRRQGLRSSHAAESSRNDKPAGKRTAELPARTGSECLISSLQDPLRADIDPAARRHLPVHYQAHLFQTAELFPGRPFGHEQTV